VEPFVLFQSRPSKLNIGEEQSCGENAKQNTIGGRFGQNCKCRTALPWPAEWGQMTTSGALLAVSNKVSRHTTPILLRQLGNFNSAPGSGFAPFQTDMRSACKCLSAALCAEAAQINK
jgi:hypothetical protein